MHTERQRLESSIAALEAQRALLGDTVVDVALASMRIRLAALTASATDAVQVLRQVAILFLDVVGSTALTQSLDPEVVADVMDDALTRATLVVDAHRGRVLQYAGDGLLAAFGVARASEDDSERSVRCGLELCELGRVLGAEIERVHHRAGFDVRVGIHTGDVVLGGGIDADIAIRGSAVNIAARMEQTAPPGGLRITHETYAQVRGLFEVAVQEPLSVKGVDEPVQSYLVIRAKPRSFRIGTRGIEGVATRMIGRDAELAVLQSAFERLFDERRLASITVVADAGVGKSRLLFEFAAWSEARPEPFYIFRGRANPQTQGQPFGLLRDMLAWRFQIGDDDTVEAARSKMELGIVPFFVDDDGPDLAEGHAHLLGHLIGIEWRESRHIQGILDDAKQIRSRALHAAAQLFRRVAARDGHPIVVQLEDLHWADNESLDFLRYLTEVDRDVPMLILGFCRPSLFERRADLEAAPASFHRRIDLQPLDKAHSRDLANELLKKLPEVPAALRELITGGSEGNPFYMEELVKMLIDQGAIETHGEDDRWRVDAERLLVTRVPATLTGVLQARLDGLPAVERLTLQEASVIGPIFWDTALIALDEQARDALPALVKRELALPRTDIGHRKGHDDGNDDLREYAFKHAILHQVTYATVLRRTRRELHGKLAHWLAARTGLRANDFLGIAAGHFEEAGDDASAAEFHARAAEHATTRMAHDAVQSHVERALALIERMPATETRADRLDLRWRLLVARESMLEMRGDRVAQRADIEALDALADALDDDRRRAHAAWRRSDLALRTADYPTMEAAGRRAVAWAERAGATELRLTAQRSVAAATAHRGDPAAGQVLAREVLSEAKSLGLRRVEGLCLNTLGVIAAMQGDVVLMLDHMQQALLVNQAAGNRRSEAVARGNLGAGWLELGALAQARIDLEEGLRLARANGDRERECGPLCNLALLSLWEGDDTRALGWARAAVETAVALHAPNWEAIAFGGLGDIELSLGHHRAAEDAFIASRARGVEIGRPVQHDAAAGLARVALAEGDVDAAMTSMSALLARDAVVGADGGLLDGTQGRRQIEWTCYEVLVNAGDARAAEWLERAYGGLQTQAARITDARLRDGFLRNIPQHREIVAAWGAARA